MENKDKAQRYFELSYMNEPLAYYPCLIMRFYMNLSTNFILDYGMLKLEDMRLGIFTSGYLMYFFVGLIFFYLLFLVSLIRQKSE